MNRVTQETDSRLRERADRSTGGKVARIEIRTTAALDMGALAMTRRFFGRCTRRKVYKELRRKLLDAVTDNDIETVREMLTSSKCELNGKCRKTVVT